MIGKRSRWSESSFTGCVTLLVTLAALPCRAIEMFTFFGDGSRIGLPSLEVPVEAYRGIPLRSDRLRARRASRQPTSAAGPQAPAGAMIRVIPETAGASPAAPPRTTTRGTVRRKGSAPAPAASSSPSTNPAGGPVAPEPPVLLTSPQQPESIPAPRN